MRLAFVDRTCLGPQPEQGRGLQAASLSAFGWCPVQHDNVAGPALRGSGVNAAPRSLAVQPR